ncbi:MAG: hypothetical protein L3J74_06070 [Bacteroidales bacterium]|nr:hypothetical protein [Bacteroidales bacterium]
MPNLKLNKKEKIQVIKYALFFWLTALFVQVIKYLVDPSNNIGFNSFYSFSRFILVSFGFGFIIQSIAKLMRS